MTDNRKRKYDDRDDSDGRSFKFKVLLPNQVAVDLMLCPKCEEMRLEDFIKVVKRKYMRVLEQSRLQPERDVQWGASNLYLQDASDRKIRQRIVFANFKPYKLHILRLYDGSLDVSDTFENMWDLTPDTELLRELPKEYTFELALADLIDNSLQALWSNDNGVRKLIRVKISKDRISIFDTGPGMDDSDEYNITKWGKMGASQHRKYKTKSIGGKPPYLQPFFGMFGYGGALASMHLGRNARVSSKTKQSKKVYFLNLRRDALLNSRSKLTWRTTGGMRDPLDDEIEHSAHGSFTKVEISELKIKMLDIHKLQWKLKDIYFPYIQCDEVSNAGKTTTPVTFQVNGDDLAEVEGGEVSITNLHSCNGAEFVFQLHFVKQDNVDSGFKVSQKAHARLRCVYFPMIKGKESIEIIQERLEAEGCGSKGTSEAFSHVSIRRLGRLLPDARWPLLPFMDFRLRRGGNSVLLKKCSSRVKCFIETDGGFNPTISKTDLAHHCRFTVALKNFGKKILENEKEVSVEIFRDGKLTLSQLEKKYQDWILDMHSRFDEEINSGEDDPIIVLGANKKALGISADVLRVHRVLKRKGECWKRGQNIKVLKGACAKMHKNSVYATLEYFLIEGFQGDAGGEAWIICRPLGTSEKRGCDLKVNYENAKLLIRDSLCLPISVIDTGKCRAVGSSEWSNQLEKQKEKNLRIDLLSAQHCEELEVDGALPSLAQIDTGHEFPGEIVAVVRPGNYSFANASRNLDQKYIFITDAAMSLQVIFESEKNGRVKCLCVAQATSSPCNGIRGLYIFELGKKAPEVFRDSGVYKFLFSLADSSCKCYEKTVKVRDASRICKWKMLSNKQNEPLRISVGSSFPLICIGCFDASCNRKPFTFAPELTVKLKMENGKHTQTNLNHLKIDLSSDNLVLQIKDLLIECNELDSIRPSYEALLVICALNESVKISIPCQVTPGPLQNAIFHLSPKEERLLPDLVVDEFALEMRDKYDNHIAEGSEVGLILDGFRIMDPINSKWKVDNNGFISLNGQLYVTASFGSAVSISVLCGDVVIKREFQILKRELRVLSEVGHAVYLNYNIMCVSNGNYIASQIPETTVAGSRLENVVFEIVDSSGIIDETIHNDEKRGKDHFLVIKSELFSTEETKFAFSKGRCVIPDIFIPQMEGHFCLIVAHSHYPEIRLTLEVSVLRTPKEISEEVGSPFSDKKFLPFQCSESLDLKRYLTPEGQNGKKRLEESIHRLREKIESYESDLVVLRKQKAEALEVMTQLEVPLDPELHRDLDYVISKELLVEQIETRSSCAAVVLSDLYCKHSFEEPEEHFMKDVVGLVALLGTVSDSRISRMLAGFLGEDQMLAVVCKSYEAASAMEKYKEDGEVDCKLALHGKAATLGKSIDDRFLVVCLEDIRPYNGEFEGSDLERKLYLPDPILPTGNVPAGFKGYAVNLINLDHSIVTATGRGLRETLFYRLFGELQVYETRTDMINARSCIKHGAVSLDGGIIKDNGIISLGHGNPKICFPVPTSPEIELLKYKQNHCCVKQAEVESLDQKIEKLSTKLLKEKTKFDRKTEEYKKLLAMLGVFSSVTF